MHLTPIGLAVSMLLFQGPTAGESKDAKPTAKQIQSAVERLGSVSPGEQKRAAGILWKAGRAAEAALKKAAKSDDPELQSRAQQLLDKMKYGIFPDTPADVVALIDRFRKGDRNMRLSVVRQLNSKKQIDTLLRLFEAETDETLKQQYGRLFGDDVLRNWLVQGKQKQAVQWLRQQSLADRRGGNGLRNYAAWVLAGGQLDAETKRLKKEVEQNADAGNTRALASLLRLGGDLKAARAMAEKAGDSVLLVNVMYDQRDWKGLVNHIPGDAGVERLGFSVAYYRLAGNRKEVERALKGLDERAKAEPRWSHWMHGEALMINNEWRRAIDLFSKHQPAVAFELLCLQQRFTEAFKIVGIDDPRKETARWFAGRAADVKRDVRKRNAHFALGLHAVRVLHSLGEADEALRLLDEVAKHAGETNSYQLGELYKTAIGIGRKDRARKLVAPGLDGKPGDRIIRSIFFKQRTEATVWWDFLQRDKPDDSNEARLSQLEKILASPAAKPADRIDFEVLADKADILSRKLDLKTRHEWLDAIVKGCIRHQKEDRAIRYAGQLAESSPTVATLLQVADAHARKKDWKTAAVWYDKAWQRDRTQALALYLHGHALAQTGEKKKSAELIAMAERLPLGDHNRRRALATGLESRGLKKQAVKHWKWMVQIGPFNNWAGGQSWSVQHAAQQLGNSIKDRDPLLAADCWERVMFYCLKTNATLLEVRKYAQVTHLVHKFRARGLIKAGRWKEAEREVWLAHAALPGGMRFVQDLLPELEKAGRKPVADKLFNTVFNSQDKVCRQFPNAASTRNNLAWMAAQCGRRLDEALKHSQRAVALVPKNPAYHDTLGLVHFKLGNGAKAIESARKAVELAPKNRVFQARLERFQKAKPGK